ncbi:MAG: universal stress protein [Actinomycetales bacterium]|nr:universal stress protein [Actinomycetales bacterium]
MHDDGFTSPSPSPADRPLGVLIGFDDSDHAVLALHYAARAAQRMEAPLTVVTAYTVPTMAYADAALIPSVPAEVARLAAAQAQLEQAREHLRGYPGEVDLRTEHGDAAGVLVRLSAQAQLAVVGARGRGGFLGRMLGSVSSALPAHAHCPTVVVPQQYEISTAAGPERFAPVADDAPVVVGVDLYQPDDSAVRHAAAAAVNRGAPLHLLSVMPRPDAWGQAYMAWLPDPDILEKHRAELETELETLAQSLRTEHAGLAVTSEVVLSDPISPLLRSTTTAQLTVLGTRGRGRVASTLLGSVSQAVLLRAEGPVMVVPTQSPDKGADAAAEQTPPR